MRKIAAALLTLALAGCESHPQSASRRPEVRLTRNTAMGELLAREYAQAIPNVDFKLVDVVGSVAAVNAIQRRDADVGVAFADVAYEAQVRASDHSGAPLGELRGMAALQVAPVHLVARAGLRITQLLDLRGRRVGTGQESSGQERLADLIFGAYRLNSTELEPVSIFPDKAAAALTKGDVDAAFLTGYYPLPPVTDAARGGARIVPIDGSVVERLTQEYPFLRRVVIPANTYPGQTDAIRTIAVDRLLVCRSDLDDALVYAMTRRLFESLPQMRAFLRTALRLMDVDEASATPIPLHEGAARYYRERELMR